MMKAPFPYFGGKSKIAPDVWRRLGPTVYNYVEPFVGSAAMLLARPNWTSEAGNIETINDANGFVANFWRATQADPEAVAHYADWPINENDLHARHAWLVQNHMDSLPAMLEGDPDYYDAKVAGWWCWGMCCWIGGGFCSGKGPWQQVEMEDGTRQLVALSNAGQGVKRQRVHLSNAGRGVNRQRVHLGNTGVGVSRPRVHLGNAGQGDAGTGEQGIHAWMEALAHRLSRVRVCCGDWSRVCGNAPTANLGTTAVFLDPPYSAEAKRASDIYATEDYTVAHDVRRWAIEHGDDPRYRIALCGYDSEHGQHMPDGWETFAWSAQGGYDNQGDGSNDNRHREVVWFSPHCVKVNRSPQMELFSNGNGEQA